MSDLGFGQYLLSGDAADLSTSLANLAFIPATGFFGTFEMQVNAGNAEGVAAGEPRRHGPGRRDRWGRPGGLCVHVRGDRSVGAGGLWVHVRGDRGCGGEGVREQQGDDDEGDEGDGELGEGGEVVQGGALPGGEGEPGEQAEARGERGWGHAGRW